MKPNTLIENILYFIKKVIPWPLPILTPAYHLTLTFIASLLYRFPSQNIHIVAVTGTKGKSTVTELSSAILEEAGYKTGLSNTLRFKIGGEEKRNLFKMSTPGRFSLQKFLRKAGRRGCDWIVLEMTSQAVLLHRHRFIALDALIFTNISPEHIEAHGSFEKYLDAKLKLAKLLNRSGKNNPTLIANADDSHSKDFFETALGVKHVSFDKNSLAPYDISARGITFTLGGKKIHSPLAGEFNLENIAAAVAFARNLGIQDTVIKSAIEKFSGVRGRLERITLPGKKQNYTVIVDYAHTPDSLEKVYKVFIGSRKICVLGNTGGGRDKWKRREMAKIAENYCEEIILTNEDPYDEDPRAIVEEMARALTIPKYRVVMDRRGAIREAIKSAQEGSVILITGKGTDPYIMEADGKKTEWDDATVAREELSKLLRES